MKKYINIFLICILFFTSCEKDILDREPLDIISDAIVWSDPLLIDAYLTEIYAEMYVLTNGTRGNLEGNNSDDWFAPYDVCVASDECRATWWLDQWLLCFGNLNIHGGQLEWWEPSYRVIRKINIFIEKVPDSPLDNSIKAKRIAEARFLRAYSYFEMVRRYGGVPLITRPQTADEPEEELFPERDSEQTIYDFVISEMDSIKDDLTEMNDYGRPCKYAALMLKSRAALYAGSIAQYGTIQLDGLLGIEPSKAIDYYEIAYNSAKQILESGKYALYEEYEDKVLNFRNLFLDEQNCEVIFVRPYEPTDKLKGGNGWAYDFMNCPKPNAWDGGNQMGPYVEMAEAFQHVDGSSGKLDREAIQQGLWTMDSLWKDKEPRFFASIYTQNTTWQGSLLNWQSGIIKPDGTTQTSGSYEGISCRGEQKWWFTGFGVLKYLDENKNNMGERATTGTDWIIFRYAEVLLNFAEAAYEIGKTGDALDAVNQVRRRAGIAEYGSIDRDKIRHERRIELAFEGHRYWDLRRWRMAEEKLSGRFTSMKFFLHYETRKYQIKLDENADHLLIPRAFYSYHYYLPITLTRTGNNPNLIENPGY
mgnify:CR=1 FL=1